MRKPSMLTAAAAMTIAALSMSGCRTERALNAEEAQYTADAVPAPADPPAAQLPQFDAEGALLKPEGWEAKRSLGQFAEQMMEAWDHDAMPAVLKLASLNYGPGMGIGFEGWLTKHGKANDTPEMAKVLHRLKRPHVVLSWMAKHTVPSVALKDLRAFVT